MRKEFFIMVAIFLSPIYILVNFYILGWGIRWMSACHHCFKKRWVRAVIIGAYIFIASSLLTAFLLPPSGLQRFFKVLSNYWLGTLLYIILTVAVIDLIRIILKRIPFRYRSQLFSKTGFVTAGTICIAIITAFSAVGIANARHIRTTDYRVSVEKSCGDIDSLNVVLIADMHLGYSIGNWHMEQMVEKINRLHPDLVVVAGDIFDNEYEALDNPDQIASTLSGIQSRYGVYACYGNHDIQEKILAGFTFSHDKKKVSDPRMDAFLEKAGIQLLMDEGVLIENSFYVYGRPDYERPGRGITTRKTPKEITASMDQTKPILVIDHEPKELKELSDAGVDLDLCGHTHDGQMFPGNLTIDLMWENACGYLKKGNMHNIVTSGIGVFGPNMRVGTKSEICNIEVNFID